MKPLILAAALSALALAGDPGIERGAQLYRGQPPLQARLAASEDDLAPAAARCMNCHGSGAHGVAEGGIVGSDIRGAILSRRVPRRGGPPAAYTRESFRTALRSGHDPASVVLSRAMPRYTLSDRDSDALWAFLVSLPSKP